MTIAILRENGDVLWFDAITRFEEQYTATVTKHPVATGGLISDHTIVDNDRFTFTGILSDADFNLSRPNIGRDFTGSTVVVGQPKQFVNNTETTVPVEIVSTAAPRYERFLPETVSQYTASKIPEVVVTPQPKVKPSARVRQDLIDMLHTKERFTLLDLNASIISRNFTNCVMTGLSFAEDSESGEGLFPSIQIEKVQYVDIERIQIKIRTPPNKGRKTGTTTSASTKEGDDAAKGPTDFSSKADSQLPKSSAATIFDDAANN